MMVHYSPGTLETVDIVNLNMDEFTVLVDAMFEYVRTYNGDMSDDIVRVHEKLYATWKEVS